MSWWGWVSVGKQNRHLDARVQLADAQGGADAGVAAADDQETTQTSSSSRASLLVNSSEEIPSPGGVGSSRMN